MSGRTGRARRATVGALSAAVALTLVTACGRSGGGSSGASTTPSASSAKDATIAAEVPSALRSKGQLTVATDASYPPNEFFGPDNKTIVGMDADLGHSLGQVLGLPFTFANVSFDSIIPNLGSRYDLGMSSFTDNKKREQQVSMVTYFSAATSFVVQSSSKVTITGLDSLCGLSVAVEKGTTQLDDATAQSAKCTQAGKKKVTVQPYPDENGVNLALSSGRANVLLADSPVNDYLVKKSNGQFKLAGPKYGTAPYGIAVPKGASYTGLDKAVLDALKKLMADGTYQQILTKWGIQAGAISNPVINGAVS
ncbi:MAG: ABC transporter substrate-binding protein [Actinomycetes bacterium]